MTDTLQTHSDDPMFCDTFAILQDYSNLSDLEFSEKVQAHDIAKHRVMTIARPSGKVSVTVQDMTTGEVHEGIFSDAESARQAAWLVVSMIDRLA